MNQSVPTFLLYGEAQASVAREFVHIEEISARSAGRNWQIGVHRHQGLFQLLFVFSGTVQVRLDSTVQEHASPLAVIVPPGVVHAFKFTPQTEGYVLTLDDEGLGGFAGAGDGDDATQAFAALRSEAGAMPLGSARGALAARVRVLLEQIANEFAHPGLGSTRMFVWLVRALLLLLVREQLLRRPVDPANERHAALMKRFRHLVESHFQEHWRVERYAQELNLTESRLNRLCRREAGTTAFALIQARLLLEARRKLMFTAVPVSQLAFELGFSDPAYFTRFFKKVAGVGPAAFRAQGVRVNRV
jgi:AraC family transcriptional activator of pobA